MGTNPVSKETLIIISYVKSAEVRANNPLGWKAVLTQGKYVETLIEGAQSIESVIKYVWRLTKNGKL